MSTPDLAAWLLEQVAADEAEQGHPATWGEGQWHHADCEVNSYAAGPCDCGLPARVLADADAKRRIVETCRMASTTDGRLASRLVTPSLTVLAEQVLRALAQPYADRSGFDEDWRL